MVYVFNMVYPELLMQKDKNTIRSWLLALRQGQPANEADQRSRHIARRILELDCLGRARQVLAYMPVRGEADPRPVIEALWERGAQVLLPRCRPDEPGVMDLAACSCYEDLSPGSFGIPEPRADACLPPEAVHPDLVLVPGVGFDHGGRRLGFGGGYYDRLLAQDTFARSLCIALAYEFQVIDELPGEAWDIPMHIIVTDKRTIEVRSC
jgi:5-formyltetrahydrofolate cyclo-ligase